MKFKKGQPVFYGENPGHIVGFSKNSRGQKEYVFKSENGAVYDIYDPWYLTLREDSDEYNSRTLGFTEGGEP